MFQSYFTAELLHLTLRPAYIHTQLPFCLSLSASRHRIFFCLIIKFAHNLVQVNAVMLPADSICLLTAHSRCLITPPLSQYCILFFYYYILQYF